jgi:hypothetical protein
VQSSGYRPHKPQKPKPPPPCHPPTPIQPPSRYYKALYGKQIGSLLSGGASKNLPGMRNLAMELRKLCCHPVSLRAAL